MMNPIIFYNNAIIMRLYYLTQHLTQHLTWHLFNSTLSFGHWLIYLFINLKKQRQLLGIGLLVTCLTCHLGKGNLFQIKSRDLVDDVAHQLYLPRGIPSLSYIFIPCLEVEILKETGFSVWYLIQKLQFVHVQILHIFDIAVKQSF